MKISKKFIKASDSICDFDNHVCAPYMRKSFNIAFKPQKAEITICGLGFYELYINGRNITKGPLAPYISNPDDVYYYDNYDISDVLVEGENTVGVILGNGFRNCFGGEVWRINEAASRGPVITALCIEAEGDGKSFELEADETFKTHPSPITFDDLRMGCRYDARNEINNWCFNDFDDSTWDFAKRAETPSGDAKICEAEPIVITDTVYPVEVKHYDTLPFVYENNAPGAAPLEGCVRNDVYVFDFGINAAGVTKLKINGRRGQKIVIHHGEYNCDGKFSVFSTGFFNNNIRKNHYAHYNQVDEYICKGGIEEFIPKFKYDGFRYAYVEGLDFSQITPDTLTYLVMNGDFKQRSSFECSDDTLNKLQECTRRSDLANFYYFPTDCPHREKNGWTGDASVSAEHMLLNLTVEKSLKEWLHSIRKAQRTDGALPGIVPTGGWGFEWGNGPAWDSVCVSLPYYIYKFTGDVSVIEENIPLIMRYLCYISAKRDERGLIAVGLGDWIDPFESQNGRIASPLELTDSITVYDMATKAAYLFNVVGRHNEGAYVKELAKELRRDIRNNLIDKDTMLAAGNCQTSQAFAIHTGIFNEDELEAAQKQLINIIHRDGNINACGMIGLRHIFHVLTDAGEADLAYKMITDTGRTGYGYWIKNGATSLWEDFKEIDAEYPDSKNHHFLGDISSWFIQEIAGLKPNPNMNDLNYFEFSPHFIDALNYAKADYVTQYGTVGIKWEKINEKTKIHISVPPQINGKLVLPRGYCLESGDTVIELHGEGSSEFTCIKIK